jgi:hypothetical protein
MKIQQQLKQGKGEAHLLLKPIHNSPLNGIQPKMKSLRLKMLELVAPQ